MIGKGRDFSLISRIADDINNLQLSIGEIVRNFYDRFTIFKEKSKNLIKGNDNKKLGPGPGLEIV